MVLSMRYKLESHSRLWKLAGLGSSRLVSTGVQRRFSDEKSGPMLT